MARVEILFVVSQSMQSTVIVLCCVAGAVVQSVLVGPDPRRQCRLDVTS